MCIYTCLSTCLHKGMIRGFSNHLPERDIKVMRALSVLLSLDKRDEADSIHLLRVLFHSLLTQTNTGTNHTYFTRFYLLCLKLMTIWSDRFVWVFPSD